MKLDEIKEAVDDGISVYWKSDIYEVIKGKAGYFVKCTLNDSAIGLTWEDGVTMNGEEEDFYIKYH